MKQHITSNQAKEVTKDQFYSCFYELEDRDDWYEYHANAMNIGKMIDYLEDASFSKNGAFWYLTTLENTYVGNEIVDVLWTAVKAEMY